MYAIEAQKNPAAMVWNMMVCELFNDDRTSQMDLFCSTLPIHSKEKG
jgi:hypothetical protein